MNINGIALGCALFFTGVLVKNLEIYMRESIWGTLIIASMGLGCWYFAFEMEEKSK